MTTLGTDLPEPPTVPSGPAGPLAVGSLCTGIAGLDLGAAAALGGTHLAWTADNDPDIARFLDARFPQVPNLGDLAEVAWRRVEPVDVITAGVPCQDISACGSGLGVEKGARSGVWNRVVDAVRLLRPSLFVVENVAALRWSGRGLGTVLGDLAAAGYDARWRCLSAEAVGAAHRRDRLFLVAHPGGQRRHAWPLAPATTPRAHPPQPRRPRPPRTATTKASRCRPHVRARATTVASPPTAWSSAGGAAGCNEDRQRMRHVHSSPEDWGAHAAAIDRWEHVLGRPAPPISEAAPGSGRRLSPAFVEWFMGFPSGWVTGSDLGLARTAQLRALGNAVVPLQAEAALHLIDEEEPQC